MSFDFNRDPIPLCADLARGFDKTFAEYHAEELEAYLGLSPAIDAAERALIARLGQPDRFHQADAWIGLPPRILQTPYVELRQWLEILKPSPGSHIVELGSGYSRLGYVIGRLYPELTYSGYEILEERLQVSRQALDSFPNTKLSQADLSNDFHALERADVYFIYDSTHREGIAAILRKLHDLALRGPFRVVARGRSSRDLIERGEPWLSSVVPAFHTPHFSIYHTHESVRTTLPIAEPDSR